MIRKFVWKALSMQNISTANIFTAFNFSLKVVFPCKFVFLCTTLSFFEFKKLLNKPVEIFKWPGWHLPVQSVKNRTPEDQFLKSVQSSETYLKPSKTF